MLSDPSQKYRRFSPVSLPDRRWPDQTLHRAPVWCSVDLRDGNQALAVPMNIAQKLELFDALVRCGFKEIEVGFPAASNTEFAFNRRLIEDDRIPRDVAIQVLVQAREDLIERTVESLRGARRVIIHLYNSTSPAQRRIVFGMSRAQVIDVAVRGARWIKDLLPRLEGTEVTLQYSPESFSATEVEFAKEIAEAVMDVWQPTPERRMILNLPDTVEVAMPNVYADQIEWMCRNIRDRASLIISLHTHNDRGTGVAATELGLLAGADRVEGTLFGNGERTGNLDLVTVALNLYMHGIAPGLDFSSIRELREVYERTTGMSVPPRRPYAGELVFTAFSGSHQDAIKKGLADWEKGAQAHWEVPYLTIDPADLGREYREVIRVNSQSGKGGVAYLLEQEIGLRLPKELQREFGALANEAVDRLGREVSGADLRAMFEAEYLDRAEPWELGDYTMSSRGGSMACEAHVREFAREHAVAGEGNGTLSAFASALRGALDAEMPAFEVADFFEDTMAFGTDAKAVAFVAVKFGEGQTAYGAAIATDAARVQLQALLAAVNRAYPWVMLERALATTLPPRLRAEFARAAREPMRAGRARFSAAELEELFLGEYVRRGDDLGIARTDFEFAPAASLFTCTLSVGSGGAPTIAAEGTTRPNAFCAAVSRLIGEEAEIVELVAGQTPRPGAEHAAWVHLRLGSGHLAWGAGFAANADDAATQAIAAAAARRPPPL